MYRETVRRALAEDLGWGDVTTEATVDAPLRARGIILAKSECVIAGLDVAAEAFRQLDPARRVHRPQTDGDRCAPGDIVAEVRGAAGAMLTAERTALNFLQRLSGIATLTRRFVDAAGGAHHHARHAEDDADAARAREVRGARGRRHEPPRRAGRRDPDQGQPHPARRRRRSGDEADEGARQDMPIEIEAQSLEQVDAAIAAGADIILLDNLSIDDIREAVRRIAGRAKVELSGGVTLDRIPELAATGRRLRVGRRV